MKKLWKGPHRIKCIFLYFYGIWDFISAENRKMVNNTIPTTRLGIKVATFGIVSNIYELAAFWLCFDVFVYMFCFKLQNTCLSIMWSNQSAWALVIRSVFNYIGISCCVCFKLIQMPLLQLLEEKCWLCAVLLKAAKFCHGTEQDRNVEACSKVDLETVCRGYMQNMSHNRRDEVVQY